MDGSVPIDSLFFLPFLSCPSPYWSVCVCMRVCVVFGGGHVMLTLFPVGLLHGDMSQGDRDSVITAFKKKEFPTLVATDVAGMYN